MNSLRRNAFVSQSGIQPALLCALMCLAPAAWGQGEAPPHLIQVQKPIQADTSRPLRELADNVIPIPPPAQPIFLGRIPYTSGEGIAQPDPVLQTATSGPQTFAPVNGLGFEGIGAGSYGFTVQYAPPDTNGAVGETQYVQWVNASYAIFSKSGSLQMGPVPGNTVWAGFGGACENNNDGDPIIQYDKIAKRWIFTQFSVSNRPYLQCFAISTTADATGPYYRFAFSFGNQNFPDYPKLGVWPDAYYMSFNIFRFGAFYSGPQACAIDRVKALNGTGPTMICYQLSSSTGSLLPSDLDGTTPPPAGSPAYFLTYANNKLQVFTFKPDFATPSSSAFTGPASVNVSAFTPACSGGTCIPQPGTGQKLDSLADRLMYRLAYRNFGDHEAMVVNHAIQTANAASGVRWYELRIDNQNQTPYLFQQGTYAPDTLSRWMGSIAMDQAGNILVGYSASGSSTFPGIRVAGRQPGDPAGLLQPETSLMAGTGSQTGGLSRWGDYSAMSVDPVDDCTFWYTNEYLPSNGSFNWKTYISNIKFDGCGAAAADDFSILATPSSQTVTAGMSTSYAVDVSAIGGFTGDVSLSVTGVPASASAAFADNTIAGGSGSTTLTVTTAANVAAQTYNLTITGTSGSLVHSTNVSLAVNPAPDFSISASPSQQTVTAGSNAIYTVTVAKIGTFSGDVALTATGLPPGAATLEPGTISGGSGSSTLTVTTSSLTAGTYTLTITGDGGSGLMHSTNVSLTVNNPAAADFSISASPSNVVTKDASATYTITITPAGGYTGTVNLSAAGSPGSATFDSSSITGGSGSATLSVTGGSRGNYTVTITGTDGTLTHSITVGYKVR